MSEIGRRFGIAMTDEALADLETLDDVKSWVEEHEDAAIAIVTWSPGCSVCEESYTAKLAEIHREDTIRLVVLACDASDTPKTLLDAVTKQNAYWRVLIDKEQKISDRFGASVTPEVFVLDTELRLRYRGAIDSDPAAAVDEGDREFLREAAAAIVMEEPVLILRTEPNGCPIKRK